MGTRPRVVHLHRSFDRILLPVQPMMLYDSELRSTQLQLANLLNRGCLTPAWSAADASTALSVLTVLSQHPDPTAEYERQYGGSNMDPLTMSLNTVRPAALRALLALLGSDKAQPIQAEILDALDGRLGFARDNSLAMAAVFGEKIATMLVVNRDWFLARVDRLLGPSDLPVTGNNAPYIDTVWSSSCPPTSRTRNSSPICVRILCERSMIKARSENEQRDGDQYEVSDSASVITY